jgi:hypothetical protein
MEAVEFLFMRLCGVTFQKTLAQFTLANTANVKQQGYGANLYVLL